VGVKASVLVVDRAREPEVEDVRVQCVLDLRGHFEVGIARGPLLRRANAADKKESNREQLQSHGGKPFRFAIAGMRADFQT
jgi:hypothetical protein